MNPAFNIQSPDIDTATAELFVEAGPTGISFVVLDAGNCFSAIVIYSFPTGISTAAIAEQVREISKSEKYLQASYKKINICWTFTESILVPDALVDAAGHTLMLDLVYGDANSGSVKSDFVSRQGMHNVYRIPAVVIDALPATWQYVGQTHQYSLLPDLATKTGNCLWVVFYSNSLTAMLSKEGQLQVIQHYEYGNADDAAYQLLNICASFDAVTDETILQASGMIDTGSNLYASLYKYFLHIELASLPVDHHYAAAIKNYPAHFFSHLFTLATCV